MCHIKVKAPPPGILTTEVSVWDKSHPYWRQIQPDWPEVGENKTQLVSLRSAVP